MFINMMISQNIHSKELFSQKQNLCTPLSQLKDGEIQDGALPIADCVCAHHEFSYR